MIFLVQVIPAVLLLINRYVPLALTLLGPVVVNIAGQSQATPIDFSSGSVTNSSFNASAFQVMYGGSGNIKLTGGASTAMVIYAPQIDAGNLREKYDVILFPTGAIGAAGVRPPFQGRPRNLPPRLLSLPCPASSPTSSKPTRPAACA